MCASHTSSRPFRMHAPRRSKEACCAGVGPAKRRQAPMSNKILRVLATPVFRRHWVFHTLRDAQQQVENGLHLRAEGAGPRSNSLADRWALAKRQMGSWWSGTVQARIKELRDAREGSLKNHVFRVIQAVLSREHPAESFLKSVPTEGPVSLVVHYPAGTAERLVRRRMRLLARRGRYHSRMRALFAMGTLLVSPLLLLPIPLSNFPVFFFVYRLQSHHQALAGARQLQAAFAAYDAAEGRDMRDRALFGEEAGRDGGATTRGADGPAGPSGSVSNAGVSGDGVSGAGVPWAGPPVPGAVFYEAVHRNAVFQNAMGASRAEVPGGGEGVGSGAGPREESAGGGSAWAAATAGLGRVAGMAAEVSGVGPRLSQGVASVGEYVDAAWARVRAVDHERRRVLRSLQGARRAVEARIEALMHRGRGDDAGGAGAHMEDSDSDPSRASELWEALGHAGQPVRSWRDPTIPVFVPSPELRDILATEELGEFPLQDQAAFRIGRLFETRGFMEQVSRARRKYSGAFFYSRIGV